MATSTRKPPPMSAAELQRRREVQDAAIEREREREGKPTPTKERPSGSLSRRLADDVLAARDAIDAVKARAELTEAAKAERIEGHRRGLRDLADQVERESQRRLADAQERALPPGPPSDPASATLYETRKGRAWQRIRPMLDAGRDPTQIAEHLVSSGDRVGVAALREELPAYRELHRQSGETPASTASMTQSILREIGDTERPLLSREELATRDALADAERAHTYMTTNIGMVRQELEGTYHLLGDGDEPDVELGTAP